MGVFRNFSAWCVKFDLAAVAFYPASTFLTASGAGAGVIIISSVVILAQHGQVRRIRLAAIFVSVDVMNCGTYRQEPAARPRADKIFCRSQDALFQGCEACFV